ncbi:putative zinc finger protein [Frankliniella fusca]|uniref:Zinc finger protein n=1 Tax=Frankliniella fusca TaxID=407009 RepID=A0AAE1GZS7_9NEOP|nr:putative zinc finger protein [Frankliniella fusca]
MDLTKVCRVCAETGVLLELFGSKTQTVSYAEDVNKCLSLEATKGDGLPSHICVSCVGLINECLRFVNKLKNVGGEKQSQRRRGSIDSSRPKSCYFCESTENHLFPLSDTAVNKTNDCFSIKVSDKETICYRCQFCLDTVHDLKLKACASLKKFYSNSLSAKEVEKTSKKKMQSVVEIVSSLKNKFKVDKQIELQKEVKVAVLDFALVIGSDILSKGTINVNEFMLLIQRSGMKNDRALDNEKKKSRQTALKQVSKQMASESSAEPKSSHPSPKRHQRVTFDIKPVSESISDDSEVSTSMPSTLSRKKRSRIVSDSDDEKPSKKSRAPAESPSSTTNFIDNSKQTRRNSLTMDKEASPLENANLKTEELIKDNDKPKPKSKQNAPRPKSKKIARKESPTTTFESPDDMASPVIAESSKENISENSLMDETDKPSKRKRGRKSDSNYSKFLGEESPPAKIQRKRRESEEKDFFSSKGKKKQWKPSISEGSDADDSNTSMNENAAIVDQPGFLKDLDNLLRYTPKSTFRPFICSVCREGYVSTVKGMLHKLVMHDPRSNLLLKLTRCDNDGEMERLKESIPFRFGSPARESALINTVSNDEAGAESDDDLFPETRPKPSNTKGSSDPFDCLVSSSYCETEATSGTRTEEPKSTAPEQQEKYTCVESSETSGEKVLDEDTTKSCVESGEASSEKVLDECVKDNQYHSVSAGAETDQTDMTGGNDKVNDSKDENDKGSVQDNPDNPKSCNDENPGKSNELHSSNYEREEPSAVAVESKGEKAEDELQNEKKETDSCKVDVQRENLEEPSAVAGESKGEKAEDELRNGKEETDTSKVDVQENAAEGCEERDRSSPSKMCEEGENNVEEGRSEIKENRHSINHEHEVPCKPQDAPIDEDIKSEFSYEKLKESEKNDSNSEEDLVQDTQTSLSETAEGNNEKPAEEVHCGGVLVGVN